MNVWEVNTGALLPPQQGPAAQAAVAAPNSSKPDWEQLVGDAALYEELRDFFCYAQLTTQSLDTTGSFGIDGGFFRLSASLAPGAACSWPHALCCIELINTLHPDNSKPAQTASMAPWRRLPTCRGAPTSIALTMVCTHEQSCCATQVMSQLPPCQT